MNKIGQDISFAKQTLDREGLVAIPTETVYGLGGNAFAEEAVLSIFKAKNRPSFDPLICHTSSMDRLDLMVRHLPNAMFDLGKAFWPGPMTLLLPKKLIVPDLVTSGLPTVGVRIPRHEMTRELLAQLDYPVAAPSANPFGYISPTSAQHVADQLGDHVDYILDGGSSQVGVESTIIGLSGDHIVVHRLGGLSLEEIEDVSKSKVQLQVNNSSNPVAPGMLKSHYAPKVPCHVGNIEELLKDFEGKKVGIISFKEDRTDSSALHISLSKQGNLQEAAKNLFSALRTMDYNSIDVILAEFVPDQGLGRAINDRLRRASVAS